MNCFAIFGASRGLGEVFHRFVPESGDKVWLVSRSKPVINLGDGIERVWIEADLSQKSASQIVASAIVPQDLIAFIKMYCWNVERNVHWRR
ncbi:MAG: hypothetical protein HC847_26185 [Hydrococcus sp. RU_2_2]|nr:hypothetical protein [Hydrococcus sp. RU_2_2]NJP21170.1 hypothetical protein [Hydrococcus sp. CRU_1_1]NJQ98900.1 hypothetical protein [Hydrococcus sp. CSU_1_8]